MIKNNQRQALTGSLFSLVLLAIVIVLSLVVWSLPQLLTSEDVLNKFLAQKTTPCPQNNPNCFDHIQE